MAAAAGFGDEVQVSTKESIAQVFGDGNDSSCYFYESLIFPVFCGCSCVQNLQAPVATPDFPANLPEFSAKLPEFSAKPESAQFGPL